MRGVAAVAGLALVAAGCGGGAGSGSADPLARAAAKTARAASVKADFAIVGPSLEGTGSGVFDNDRPGAGKLTIAVRSRGHAVTVDTITLGRVLYLRSGVFRQAGLPAGKEWVRLDLAKLAGQQAIDAGGLAGANASPSGALAYLGGARGGVETVGSEKVRGVETTHYKARIDLERAAERSTGRARDSIRRVIRAGGVRRIPVEAWIDRTGYVRKLIYTEHSSRGQSAKITMELHDFGPHVSIPSPPSKTVVDFQDLLQARAG